MVQMGDPTGTGKGGECVWGGKFDDEFIDTLKHNTRGILSWPTTDQHEWVTV